MMMEDGGWMMEWWMLGGLWMGDGQWIMGMLDEKLVDDEWMDGGWCIVVVIIDGHHDDSS